MSALLPRLALGGLVLFALALVLPVLALAWHRVALPRHAGGGGRQDRGRGNTRAR